MAGPLSLFRKYQFILMVALVFVAMGSFVVAPSIDEFLRARARTSQQAATLVVEYDGGKLYQEDLERLRTAHNVTIGYLRAILQETMSRNGTPRGRGLRRGPFGQIVDPGIPTANSEAELVYTVLLSKRAESLGLRVSDEAILEFLDHLSDGVIPRNEYGSILDAYNERIPERLVLEQLRIELLAQNMRSLMLAGLYVAPGQSIPPAEAWQYFQRLHRRVQAEAVPFPVENYVNQVTEPPSETVLRELYEEGKNRFAYRDDPTPGFKQRHQAAFQYVKVNFDDLVEAEKAKILDTITDQQIEEHYAQNKERYRELDLPDESENQPKENQPKENQPKEDTPKEDTPKEDTPKEDAPEKDSADQDAPGSDAGSTPAPDSDPGENGGESETSRDAAETGTPEESVGQEADASTPRQDAPSEAEPSSEAGRQGSALHPARPSGGWPSRVAAAFAAVTTPGRAGPFLALAAPVLAAQDEADNAAEESAAEDNAADDGPSDEAAPDAERQAKNDGDAQDAPPAGTSEAGTTDTKDDAAAAGDANETADDAGADDEKRPAADPAESDAESRPQPPAATPAGPEPPETSQPDETAQEPPAPRYRPLDDELRAEIRDELARSEARGVAQSRLEDGLDQVRRQIGGHARKLRAHRFKQKSEENTADLSPPSLEELETDELFVVGQVPAPGDSRELVDALDVFDYELGNAYMTQFVSWPPQQIPFAQIAFQADLPLYAPREIEGEESGVRYLFWKTKQKESYVPEFTEVRDKVEAVWRRQQALELARKAADDLLKKAQAQEEGSLADLVGEGEPQVIETNEFSWMSTGASAAGFGQPSISQVDGIEGIGPDFMRQVFQLEDGQTARVSNDPLSVVYVLRVVSDSPTRAELRERFLATGVSPEVAYLANAENTSRQRAWYEELEEEMGVTWAAAAPAN